MMGLIQRDSKNDPMSRRFTRRMLGLVIAVFVAGSVCPALAAQPERSAASARPPVKVVATIGMIADVAKEVGKDHVRVSSLMGEGVDPHLYKASPGDVRAMSDADIVLYNGLHLEGRMADVIVKMAGRRTVAQVTDSIDEKLLREPPEFQGQFDPHIWFDVSLWMNVSDRIRDVFREKDPANAGAYDAAAAAYAKVLEALNEYAKTTIATIPKDHRVMVTAHDAFGYFGRAYGLEVRAIQGVSTDSEASLKDINGLVDALVSAKVPAVFIESSVPRKTIDALVEGCKGRGHTIVIGGELFSDAMGKDGTLDGTYVGMVLHNVDTITRALGGKVPEKKPGVLGEYVTAHSSMKQATPGGR